jgi:iduronate 2-sulfatase
MNALRFALMLALGLAAWPALRATAHRPNVLFLCADDLKPLLGCYGDARVKTPHIDRLATRGVTFDRAYCNAAVCAPSRISLLTGQRPSTLGIYDLATVFRTVAPETVTLAQYFRQHGWHTASLGKVMHDKSGHEDPASWSVPHWYPPNGLAAYVYARPENIAQQQRAAAAAKSAAALPAASAARRRGPAVESTDVPDTAYSDGLIADEAILRLRRAHTAPSEPFFLAVGFIKPHLPFCAPRKYWDLYDRAAFALPAVREPPRAVPAYTLTGSSELNNYSDMPATRPLPDTKQRELIHGYHAAVSYMDAQVGRVLDELDRLKLTERTIIVLWGDHGWHLGDHGFWGKSTNFEEAARIPLIVSAPGVGRPGTRTSALVETVDLYPTLAELAGLPTPKVPQALDGRSFATVLRDPASSVRTGAFHSFPRTKPSEGQRIGHAVRTERHRLVEWKEPGAADETADLELYDYAEDPLETRNVAAGNPAVVAQLRALLATQPTPRPQVKTADVRP